MEGRDLLCCGLTDAFVLSNSDEPFAVMPEREQHHFTRDSRQLPRGRLRQPRQVLIRRSSARQQSLHIFCVPHTRRVSYQLPLPRSPVRLVAIIITTPPPSSTRTRAVYQHRQHRCLLQKPLSRLLHLCLPTIPIPLLRPRRPRHRASHQVLLGEKIPISRKKGPYSRFSRGLRYSQSILYPFVFAR